jgi:hypothetical protein
LDLRKTLKACCWLCIAHFLYKISCLNLLFERKDLTFSLKVNDLYWSLRGTSTFGARKELMIFGFWAVLDLLDALMRRFLIYNIFFPTATTHWSITLSRLQIDAKDLRLDIQRRLDSTLSWSHLSSRAKSMLLLVGTRTQYCLHLKLSDGTIWILIYANTTRPKIGSRKDQAAIHPSLSVVIAILQHYNARRLLQEYKAYKMLYSWEADN